MEFHTRTSFSPLRRALLALWPAFLIAGVQTALVFVVVDPADLRWLDSAVPLGWSLQAVYTVTFLIFWFTTSIAAVLAQLLLPPAGGAARATIAPSPPADRACVPTPSIPH